MQYIKGPNFALNDKEKKITKQGTSNTFSFFFFRFPIFFIYIDISFLFFSFVMEESSLLAWINLHYEISQLEEFRRVQTLILFLQQLFQIPLKSDTIPDILKELKDELPIPMNTDITEDDLIRLLEYIQQQYQAYTIKKHLSNKELTFSEYVRFQFILFCI